MKRIVAFFLVCILMLLALSSAFAITSTLSPSGHGSTAQSGSYTKNNPSLTILYEGYNYPSFNDYAAAGHEFTYCSGTFNDIATAIAELTEDDTLELQYMREAKQSLIDNPYDITAEDVAHYQDIAQYAYIYGDSPVFLDGTLQTLIQRYLNGAFDANGFAEACQEHVNQIYQELGMHPVQKIE